MISLSSVLPYLGLLLLCIVGGVGFAVMEERSAYLDRDDVVVMGPRTHLRVARTTFRDAGQRRGRGVGPALDAQLDGPARRASRWRRIRAAIPTTPLLLAVPGLVAGAAFQGLWAMGRDVDATMVRAVEYVDDGYTDSGVSWPDSTDESVRSGYAEIDCYEPYPAVGDVVPVRVLAFPFEGSALDKEGTYEGLTSLTAGPALLSLLVLGGVTLARLRRPAIRLGRLPTPEVSVAPPAQRAWTPVLIAVSSVRWWPVVVLGGLALLFFELPMPLRYGLGAGAVGALAWALGRTPRWMVCLVGPQHPPVQGRCGVRGELVNGGAVSLRIAEEFWPTSSPVVRADGEVLSDLRDDVAFRLGPAGGRAGRPGPVG